MPGSSAVWTDVASRLSCAGPIGAVRSIGDVADAAIESEPNCG
jgi:hypothetical protein